jgi:hypothetical protein
MRKVIAVDNSNGRVDMTSLKGLLRFPDVLENGSSDGIYGSVKGDLVDGLDPDDVVNIQFTSGLDMEKMILVF